MRCLYLIKYLVVTHLSFFPPSVVQDIYLVGESEVEQYWQLEGVGGKEVVEGG